MEYGDGSAQTSWTGVYMCERVCAWQSACACVYELVDVVGKRGGDRKTWCECGWGRGGLVWCGVVVYVRQSVHL